VNTRRRLLEICCLLLASLVAVTSAAGQAPRTGAIVGRVVDGDTGEPLPGANLFLEGTVLGAAADRQGRFRIRRVPSGRHILVASMIGYKTERLSIEVRAGEATSLQIILRQSPIDFDPIVVTASKRSQRLGTISSSVSILSGEEIQARNRFRLDDALAEVPGVNFMEETINVRGSSGYSRGIGSRVSVLVDGIPVNSVDMDGTNWDILPILAIERVEVVKGALSALYGSDATGGVVNLITQSPSSKPITRIFGVAGVYDQPYTDVFKWTDRLLRYDGIEVSHSRRFGRLGVTAVVGRHESTGYRENGHYQRTKVSGKLSYDFANASRLTLFGTWIKEKRGEFIQWRDQNHPFQVPRTDINNRIKLNHLFVYARYDWPIHSKLLLRFRSSLNSALLGNQFAISGEFKPGQGFENEVQMIYMPPGHVLTLGGTYRYANSESKFWQGRHNENAFSFYVQDEAKLVQGLRLNLWPGALDRLVNGLLRVLEEANYTIGLRFDRHVISDISEQQLNPKLGLNYQPTENTTVRASLGKGFRYPSVVERFVDVDFGGFNIIENRDLRPEIAWTRDISIRQNLTQRWFVELSLFQNSYRDLIQAVADASGTVQFQNVSRARIRGLEVSTRGSWWNDRFSLWAGLTLLDPKDLESGRTLIYRRKVVVSAVPTLRIGSFELGARYLYGSRVEEVEIYPLDQRVPQKQLDARLTYRLRGLELSLEVRNVLNYHYTHIERNMREIRNLRTVVRAAF
jgi:iron complex outermembrane receptor protein